MMEVVIVAFFSIIKESRLGAFGRLVVFPACLAALFSFDTNK